MSRVHAPLEVMMMLHYYCMADEFPHINAPAQTKFVNRFLREGVLEPRNDPNIPASYVCTPKGEAFVEAILSVPLPVMEWRIPWYEVGENKKEQ